MTQHDKIYQLVKGGDWVCQTLFWEISKSPHKRRGEMSSSHKDFKECHRRFQIEKFEERKCEHGVDGAKDYRIINRPREIRGFVNINGERKIIYK